MKPTTMDPRPDLTDTPRVHRSHHRDVPVQRTYPQDPVARRKPQGLWWAPGDAWGEYHRHASAAGTLRARGLSARTLGRHAHRLTLDSQCRLLSLDTGAELMPVMCAYGVMRGGPHVHEPARPDRERWNPDVHPSPDGPPIIAVAWAEVARDYDAVQVSAEVLVYARKARVSWLSDWAVPGGCVWRPHASTLTFLPPEHAAHPRPRTP